MCAGICHLFDPITTEQDGAIELAECFHNWRKIYWQSLRGGNSLRLLSRGGKPIVSFWETKQGHLGDWWALVIVIWLEQKSKDPAPATSLHQSLHLVSLFDASSESIYLYMIIIHCLLNIGLSSLNSPSSIRLVMPSHVCWWLIIEEAVLVVCVVAVPIFM